MLPTARKRVVKPLLLSSSPGVSHLPPAAGFFIFFLISCALSFTDHMAQKMYGASYSVFLMSSEGGRGDSPSCPGLHCLLRY